MGARAADYSPASASKLITTVDIVHVPRGRKVGYNYGTPRRRNNNFWVLNGSGSLPNTEMTYNTSTRIDHKRNHQWFMDTAEQELLFNKKQAIESVKATSGTTVLDNWRDSSSSQSGVQTGNCLFSPKPVRNLNVSNKSVSSTVSDFVNMEKRGYENQFGNDSSISLTMSNAVEDPLCLNTGLRKGKVNQVDGISENCLREFGGTTFYPGEKNKLMGPTFHRTGNNMFHGRTYNTTTDANTISVGPDFSKIDKDFISVGQASSKTDGNFMLPNQYYNGVENNMLSIGQAFNKGNYNINAVGEQYEKENGNFMSVGPTYSKGHENFFTVNPFYNKANETFMSAASPYNKGDTDTVVSLGPVYNKDNSSVLPVVENYKGQQTTISFGGFQNNNHEESDPSGRLVSNYDIMLNQSSGEPGQKNSADQLSANVVSATTSKTDGAQKTKETKSKKGSSNNFPSNVKSLLSTGILDGVPVKYVSWSREKNLRGVIKGTGYLCSCQDCKLNKVINAYEFERHAGCKTKHPNNHIYFENGKTIYAVVQELKSTPQEILFEVIQNVTGSPVNQKNFQTWKASYKAATRELQRIYGQDEVIVQS
ncbi:hypothetical protein BUALT_Bualt05G0055500 [Buddleja alternifolia]|uniref:Tify domain-containing protein n=1 Tax=Buddleja alternifolia TaxID=168488 RepID=A0AAV6XQD3_9LAMI|nr:hypothetical protein BUALT_Bualt05G0055500 [Buddleja alternifolia]